VNNSQASQGSADALLHHARVGTLHPQQTRVQPVPAFRRASIGMLPARNASLGGTSPARQATLFPGTVATVSTEFVHVTAVFGQLIEHDGTPLGGGILTGLHGNGGSDESGLFQIDISTEEEIAVRRLDGTVCNLRLAAPRDVAVHDAGQVKCR
jgi:hypothetical protein